MNKEQAKDELIKVLEGQVMDLVMMSKIELGDDVIAEIVRLKTIINEQPNKRYIRNEEEFIKITAEVRNRQYEENPIGVDISGLGGWDSKRFSPTFTYDWDNEYLEIERIDNVDVVKLRKYVN
jgi:hypothetical protein